MISPDAQILFFSNQFASRQGHGIARYAHHLVRHLNLLADGPGLIPVAAWTDREPDDLGRLTAETGLKILPTGRRLTPLLWTLFGRPRIERFIDCPVELVHANSLGYPLGTSKPLVVTVHDIGPLTHPEFFTDKPTWIMRKSLDQAVLEAAALICVSQATADSLSEYVRNHYRADLSERISVIHEGVSEHFFQTSDPEDQTGTNGKLPPDLPFILAVGKISPRKNLNAAIRALDRIKEKIPHHLVMVGGDGWDFERVRRKAGELGIADRVHFLGYVDDDALSTLYRRASLFIYPSLFEGFGLTVLEAMASGCPVITSNLSSLPEVAGDAAVLVAPRDIDEIASAMLALCTDEGLAREYSIRGIARAKTFTWERCAQKVSAVYHRVLA